VQHLVRDGRDGQEKRSSHADREAEGADGKAGLVDDLVLPGVGEELLVVAVRAAPDAQEGVRAEREETKQEKENLERKAFIKLHYYLRLCDIVQKKYRNI
jgi:hypothetical protein